MYRKILQKAKLCSALLKDLILRCPRRTNLCLHFSRSQGLRTNTVPHGTDYSRGTSLTSLTFSCFVSRVRIREKKTAPSWAPAWRDVMWCDVTSREVMWQPDALKRVQLKTSRNPVKKKKSKRISSLSRAPENTDTTTNNVGNATTSTTPTTSTMRRLQRHRQRRHRHRHRHSHIQRLVREEKKISGKDRTGFQKKRTKILIGCVFNWERNNPLWKKNLGRSFWGFQRTALIPSQALPFQNNDLHFNWNKSGPCLSR